jgi:hypothetical protein
MWPARSSKGPSTNKSVNSSACEVWLTMAIRLQNETSKFRSDSLVLGRALSPPVVMVTGNCAEASGGSDSSP